MVCGRTRRSPFDTTGSLVVRPAPPTSYAPSAHGSTAHTPTDRTVLSLSSPPRARARARSSITLECAVFVGIRSRAAPRRGKTAN